MASRTDYEVEPLEMDGKGRIVTGFNSFADCSPEKKRLDVVSSL